MNGYLVVVEGDYFGAASQYDRKREKYPYRITVKVPSPKGVLSLIKNKLLDKVLRRNYENYHMWRTHQLVSITNLDGSKVYGLTDPRLMDFNDLASYVQKHKLPLKLELYTDLGYLRTMVYLAETNRHEFHIKQANLEKDYKEDMALAELNPEIFNSQGSQRVKDLSEESKGGFPARDQIEVTKEALKASRMTTILEGKEPVANQTVEGDVYLNKTVEVETSPLITEDKLETQKVEKVFVKGKGFVNVDDFKEDFTKPEEKEFENYEPHKITKLDLDEPVVSVEDL